jgi:hypothetical protein
MKLSTKTLRIRLNKTTSFSRKLSISNSKNHSLKLAITKKMIKKIVITTPFTGFDLPKKLVSIVVFYIFVFLNTTKLFIELL